MCVHSKFKLTMQVQSPLTARALKYGFLIMGNSQLGYKELLTVAVKHFRSTHALASTEEGMNYWDSVPCIYLASFPGLLTTVCVTCELQATDSGVRMPENEPHIKVNLNLFLLPDTITTYQA